MFTIYPAIDLRNGRVVRLRQGRADNEIVYADDPVETALRWESQGATWLHVVNLDGAFGHADNLNAAALYKLLASVHVPVQVGGGMRDAETLRRAFEMGVARAIIGTAAVEQPDFVAQAIQEFGRDRIVVGIDARDGIVATRGWVAGAGVDAKEFGKRMREAGVVRAIVTDIARDGMLSGIDAREMAEFAQGTGLQVIASGGVATLQDIQNLRQVAPRGVEGVIIGQALYTGAVKLSQALGFHDGQTYKVGDILPTL